MNNNFGIMQGRLLPKFKGQYQSHPVGYWDKEYSIASKLGLNNIEFIFDLYLYRNNPIISDIDYSIEIQKNTGVNTKSICADFFMYAPIQQATEEERRIFKSLVSELIINLSKLGGTDIVIPFVDNSKIVDEEDKKLIIDFLDYFEVICKDYDINLCLETDLNPIEFNQFINRFNNEKVSINYDSGNSASLGYSIVDELGLYGNKITNIHIKDRLINGTSVELGKGDADLKYLKDFILKTSFDGILTFQSFRDDEGIQIFKKQFEYFRNL